MILSIYKGEMIRHPRSFFHQSRLLDILNNLDKFDLIWRDQLQKDQLLILIFTAYIHNILYQHEFWWATLWVYVYTESRRNTSSRR